MNVLDNKIIDSFKEISNRIMLIQKEVIKELKISLNYYKAIIMLKTKKDVNQKMLGSLCYLDKAATSRLIDKMFNENLISRQIKDGNKKNLYVNLTGKGNELAEKIKNKFDEIKIKYFANLCDEQKQSIAYLLDNILKGEENA